MKIAFCYNGKLRGGKDDQYSIESLKKHSKDMCHNHFKCDSYDIYCHSWHPSLSKEIDEILKPVRSIHEPEQDFQVSATSVDLIFHDMKNSKRHKLPFFDYIKNFHTFSKDFPPVEHLYRYYSNATSIKKVVNLVKESNIKYDVLVLCRYDSKINKTIDMTLCDLNFVYVLQKGLTQNELHDGNQIIKRTHIFPELIMSSFKNIHKYTDTLLEHIDLYRSMFRSYKNFYKGKRSFYDHAWKSYHLEHTLGLEIKQLDHHDMSTFETIR